MHLGIALRYIRLTYAYPIRPKANTSGFHNAETLDLPIFPSFRQPLRPILNILLS
jgi:hypothetical protein